MMMLTNSPTVQVAQSRRIFETMAVPRGLLCSASGRVTAVQGTKWPFVFLLLFTGTVYARPQDIVPLLESLHLPLVLGICAGLTYLGALLSGKARFIWTRELRIVLCLTLWFAAGIPWAFWRSGSLQLFATLWLKTVIVFFLLTQTSFTLARIRKLLWTIILGILTVASLSTLGAAEAVWIDGRMFGVNRGILGWNFFGLALAIMIPYMTVLFIHRPSSLKMGVLLVTLLTSMRMLLLTASRGGFVNAVFSIMLTSILVLRLTRRGRILLAVIVLGFVVSIATAPSMFWERMGTVWGGSGHPSWDTDVARSAQDSEDDRKLMLKHAVQYTLDRPLFGLGLGNFAPYNGTTFGEPRAWLGTHNTFAQVASEGGVPALAMFLWLFVVVIRKMHLISKTSSSNTIAERESRLLARATVASILSFAFGCFLVHVGYDYYFYYLVAIAVGIQIRSANCLRRVDAVNLTTNHEVSAQLVQGNN